MAMSFLRVCGRRISMTFGFPFMEIVNEQCLYPKAVHNDLLSLNRPFMEKRENYTRKVFEND